MASNKIKRRIKVTAEEKGKRRGDTNERQEDNMLQDLTIVEVKLGNYNGF
jgi:hypothetical protein